MARRSNKKKKASGSEEYPTSVTGWYKDDDEISLVFKVTPDFLEEILELYEDGDEGVVDEYDDGYARILMYLIPNTGRSNTDLLGSAFIGEPEKRSRGRGRKKNSRRSRDEDDELPSRSKRGGRRRR